MRAARQGDFDALCGLYSIVNAIEVVGIKGPRSAVHRALFRRLTAAIDEDELHYAVWYGMSADELVVVARRAFRSLRRRFEVKLTVSLAFRGASPADWDAFLDWLDNAMNDPRQAVIINFVMPWTDHWAVAVERKGLTLMLRDSSGRKSLDLRRFRLRGGYYRIRAANTVLIKRVGGPDQLSTTECRGRVRHARHP